MWTWIPVFLAFSFRQSDTSFVTSEGSIASMAAFGAFAVIAIGGLGSLVAGRLADSWGRTRTTILSMFVSGTCALVIGFFVGSHPAIVIAIALVWGMSIVADSAQFSASVSELADKEYVGTQLTTQTAMGFLLTMVSIRLVPEWTNLVGWRWAFAFLAIGPAFGIWAMWRLKNSPDASRLAAGRG